MVVVTSRAGLIHIMKHCQFYHDLNEHIAVVDICLWRSWTCRWSEWCSPCFLAGSTLFSHWCWCWEVVPHHRTWPAHRSWWHHWDRSWRWSSPHQHWTDGQGKPSSVLSSHWYILQGWTVLQYLHLPLLVGLLWWWLPGNEGSRTVKLYIIAITLSKTGLIATTGLKFVLCSAVLLWIKVLYILKAHASVCTYVQKV